ncbi:hypothetical protein H4R21_003464 [Coemansia helicoidea]|uniref:Uncharacterized protein n=1 Tax=Coemansia helicoidea TaxID=1286919 RepID=A0ACC1L349_9FUNG|nr:hypothetical protein H4R21_003464 [Coemansia helicoidea]
MSAEEQRQRQIQQQQQQQQQQHLQQQQQHLQQQQQQQQYLQAPPQQHLQQAPPPQLHQMPSTYRAQGVAPAAPQVSAYAFGNALPAEAPQLHSQSAAQSSFRRFNTDSNPATPNPPQQYRAMQGLPPNVAVGPGIEQMQQLPAAYQQQPADMAPQHPGTRQPVAYMQPIAGSQGQPVAHGTAPHAMMYGQPQGRKVVPPSDRMVLRSGVRTTVAPPVSPGAALPGSGTPVHQRFHQQGPHDDAQGGSAAHQYGDAL